MTIQTFENTRKLFETIKNYGFLKRLFAWRDILNLAIDASAEFKNIDEKPAQLSARINELEKELSSINLKLENEKDNKKELEHRYSNLESKYNELSKESKEFEKTIAEYKKLEQKQKDDYEKEVNRLSDLQAKVEARIEKLNQDREDEKIQKLEDMKRTWRNHEDSVEQTIIGVSKKYGITYLDKESVPFSGKPDNTIVIAGEHIIFDAKSPQNDSLDNFPKYIKEQTKSVKKYIKEKDVKKTIFLVVPTNTISEIKETAYNMGDYDVFVITEDSIEPIILSLQKIEDYEFTENLSPEERDNISRVVGNFAHTIKRRVQIDQFFSDRFIEVLSRTHTLPESILTKAQEYEVSDVLNVPLEKRKKKMEIDTLKKESERLSREAGAKDILIDKKGYDKIEEIPLRK